MNATQTTVLTKIITMMMVGILGVFVVSVIMDVEVELTAHRTNRPVSSTVKA